MVKLIGRTALVTGAGTGIGEAIARRLVPDGARVCAVGRTAKTLETLVTSLPEGAAVSVVADVANHDEVFEAVAAAARYGDGVLDIIVNNAGIGPVATIEDGDIENWEKTLAVNLTGRC